MQFSISKMVDLTKTIKVAFDRKFLVEIFLIFSSFKILLNFSTNFSLKKNQTYKFFSSSIYMSYKAVFVSIK